ncbi:MAG: undecaprenyl/decaprenyl-phosphate alpha-N-acetylglucosaminyl 1-phosphate transferase [Magnetococcales bacterium]|nr:undecaprenyl/decaprenyl-phosphate alpha-N-acetylglucosaminyl 1-phosphate transferase [Magnetococcales bacterium]
MTEMTLPWQSLMVGFGLTAMALQVGMPLAQKIGWVDRPSKRKRHKTPTPLIGGAAMFFGYVPALLLQEGLWFEREVFLVVAGLALIVGFVDDWETLRARFRFLTEFAIALMITAWGGVAVHTLGDLVGLGEVVLGVWEIPFTMICLVGVINAVNMSDGLDGMAGGQSLVSLLMLFVLAALVGRWQEAWWVGLSVMVLIPFLLLNAPLPGRGAARIFMGDAGSMFLGLTLAWFTVTLSQGSNPAFAPVTALWLVAVPLIDMFSSILRRLLTGRKPFSPDLQHMHNLFLVMGFAKGEVFLIMVGLTSLFGIVGIAADFGGVPHALMFYLLLVLFAAYSWASIGFWKRHENC